MAADPRQVLIVALKPEWAFLRRRYAFERLQHERPLYRFVAHPDTLLLQTGPGWEAAESAIPSLHARFPTIQKLLCFGTATALKSELVSGTLLLATSIAALKTPAEPILPLVVSSELTSTLTAASVSFRTGPLATSPEILKNAAEKTTAAEKSAALAADMESYGIAAAAKRCNINTLCFVRGIFDALEDDLEAIGEPYDGQGNISPLKMARNLITHPELILTLPDLINKLRRLEGPWETAINWFLKSD